MVVRSARMVVMMGRWSELSLVSTLQVEEGKIAGLASVRSGELKH